MGGAFSAYVSNEQFHDSFTLSLHRPNKGWHSVASYRLPQYLVSTARTDALWVIALSPENNCTSRQMIWSMIPLSNGSSVANSRS
jgi:hypothetical protein